MTTPSNPKSSKIYATCGAIWVGTPPFRGRAARLRDDAGGAAESQADCQQLRHTLGVLMHDHPARAIVLRLNEKPGLDASVFSQCWMPFGKHQQICAEGIEITAGAMELTTVAQLLLPLIVSDLPAVLWCRGGRVFSGDDLAPLLPLVQR